MASTQQLKQKRRRGSPEPRARGKRSLQDSARLFRGRTIVICVLLTIATALVYHAVAGYPFVNYDDTDYVTENQHVQAGLTWSTVTWAMTTGDAANWHPLTWLSHALDCQVYGLDAHGHHVTNLFIHILNALLLFLLLLRVTGAAGPSAAVASLFALHPLNVESVAWIAERKNLLSTFFFFLALGAYGWYAQRRSWLRYALLAFLFVLGLASKPMVITLPCVLLLLDYWPLGRVQGWTSPSPPFPVEQLSWKGLVVEKVPLFLLSAASAVVTIVVQQAGNSVKLLGDLPLRARLGNALYSYAMYLRKVVWPVNLAPFYPHPLDTLTAAQVSLSGLLLAGISFGVWKYHEKHRYAIVGWLWFLGTLVPVIGIVQVGGQAMADRYAYLPTIGIFLMVVWTAAEWLRSKAFGVRLGAAVAVGILVALSLATYRQVEYWQSSLDLWTHTLQVTQNNYLANDNLGFLMLSQGRPEALDYFETAARISPSDPVSHAAVAAHRHDEGKLQDAIREYSIALRGEADPKFRAHVYCDLGVIYRELGDYAEARQNSQQALSLDPQEVRDNIEQLAARVAQSPAAPGYWRLGLLLEGANQIAEAKAAYERALQLNPQFAPASRALRTLVANPQ